MSLDRLRSIGGYDERLGCVSVQPGVTFRQLDEYLRARGSRLCVGAPGSTPEASVVGNTLERGILQGLRPDRAGQICALEVVMPNGECIHTGMAALRSAAAHLHSWGLGPGLDGLFLQSNLGVVTEMTVWLDPLPAQHQHLAFVLSDRSGLEALLDGLQVLRMEGTIDTSIGLHNSFKVISLQEQYPFSEAGGRTPLPAALHRRLVDAPGGGSWFGEAALHAANDEILDGLRERVESLLDPLVDELTLSAVNEPGPFFGSEAGHGLHQAYWRKPTPPPDDMDPDRDRCGVIWHAPVLPFEGRAAVRCVELAERLLPEQGFEPILSLLAVSSRCLYAIVSILYDRDIAGEDERAARCYRELSGALSAEGFESYRLGLLGMERPPVPEPSYRALLHLLKRTLDPNRILAPGRYDFGPDRSGHEEDPPF